MLPKKSSFLALMTISSAAFAQEIEYINPPAIQGDQYKIELSDIVSQKDYCKLRINVENISKDHYLRYNFSKTGFKYDAGTYFSDRGKDLVVSPQIKKGGVAEVKGNAGFLVHVFDLQLDGLSAGKIPMEPLSVPEFDLEVGKTNSFNIKGFDVSTVKVEQSKKKDKVTAQIKVSFDGQDNQMGLVDLKSAAILDKSGKRVGEFNIAPDKLQELTAGEDFKINISITSTETAFVLAWVGAFKVVNFEPVKLDPVNIRSASAPKPKETVTTTTTAVNTNCTAYVGNKSGGRVKINIHNAEAECFSLTVNGIALPQETANATLYMDQGKKDAIFTFSSGLVLTEKFMISDTWDEATYKLKKNAKGEYVLNLDLTSLVLNEKAANTGNGGGNTDTRPEWDVLMDGMVLLEINTRSIEKKGNVTKATVRQTEDQPSMIFNGEYYKSKMIYYEVDCANNRCKARAILYSESGKVVHEQTYDWGAPDSTPDNLTIKYLCK